MGFFTQTKRYFNEDTINFLSRNGADIDALLADIDCNVYKPSDINKLISKNGFYKEKVPANISIADIVGHGGYGESEDIFSSFSNFFDSNGDGYHSRSIGLLDYSSEEIIEKLGYSFNKEPICVQEIDKGKYAISTNGMHRFTVLRAHYLMELQRVKDDLEEIQKLREKYTIPVRLQEVDYLKSYSKFLIKCSNCDYNIYSELDENYDYTGNVEIHFGDNKRVLNDEELIEFARKCFLTLSDNQKEIIDFFASKYETFNEFMLQNFSKEIGYETNFESERVR